MDHPESVPSLVDEAVVENHDRALAVVQRLLRQHGIRAHRHHTISLGLVADRAAQWPDQPPVKSSIERHPPVLSVRGLHGWPGVTVTIGERSGCYLVSVGNGTAVEMVRRDQPEKVLGVILAKRRQL
ncbi:hypothetical protein GCM10022252_41580 [Streptosporangium oxazolinicum]|uniref:Uncharacterized protein n=1 Tax=Streptosporangium oxazolinicum TaxID=909287 RepID=A0ABP8B1U9_9ACTN